MLQLFVGLPMKDGSQQHGECCDGRHVPLKFSLLSVFFMREWPSPQTSARQNKCWTLRTDELTNIGSVVVCDVCLKVSCKLGHFSMRDWFFFCVP